MNPFNKRSLSFKLVLIFLLTAVTVMITLRFAMNNSFDEHLEKSFRPHLKQYFTYINDEIGIPPNLDVASKLSDSLNVRIIIKGPELNWS